MIFPAGRPADKALAGRVAASQCQSVVLGEPTRSARRAQYSEYELPGSFGPATGTPEQGIDDTFILYAGHGRCFNPPSALLAMSEEPEVREELGGGLDDLGRGRECLNGFRRICLLSRAGSAASI